jgi:subtilisin family serine protease
MYLLRFLDRINITIKLLNIGYSIMSYSDAVNYLNAGGLRSAGFDGTGVTVAVLDTGVGELTDIGSDIIGRYNENFKPTTSAITKTGGANLQVANRHADAMASAIAGNRGLAPGAKIISGLISISGDGGATTMNMVGALQDLEDRAFVYNLSFAYGGMEYYKITTAYANSWNEGVEYLTRNNSILVRAGGNSRENITNSMAITSREISDILKTTMSQNIIMVGAVDNLKQVTSYSAIPGSSVYPRLRWLCAYDTADMVNNDGTVSSFAGTSTAAANVSGAIALLKNKFPTLGGKTLINILFRSADKNFVGYDTTKHGNGVINVTAAETYAAYLISKGVVV